MSSIRQAIYSILTSDTTLSELTGGQVYSVKLPDDVTYPCLRFSEISDTVGSNLSGSINGLHQTRQQFDIYGKTQDDIDAISAQLEVLLPGAKQIIAVAGGNIYIEGIADLMATATTRDPDQPNIFTRCMDFSVWYRRTAA